MEESWGKRGPQQLFNLPFNLSQTWGIGKTGSRGAHHESFPVTVRRKESWFPVMAAIGFQAFKIFHCIVQTGSNEKEPPIQPSHGGDMARRPCSKSDCSSIELLWYSVVVQITLMKDLGIEIRGNS